MVPSVTSTGYADAGAGPSGEDSVAIGVFPPRKRRSVRERVAARQPTHHGAIHLMLARRAPMGDPIELRLRGYSLSIRGLEAAAIDVETR